MYKLMDSTTDRFQRWTLGAGYTLYLLWETVLCTGHAWEKRAEILRQTYTCTFGSFPVTMLVAIFTGMVLSLQSGLELARWGQEANVGYLVSLSMCRELGPVMTGFILAGLVGSTMAAELGTMKVSEEIDALEVMSISPIKFLVMPRFLAMCFACPILTIYTNIIGILGGSVVSKTMLNVSMSTYLDKSIELLTVKDIYSGMVKALVFGATISIVGCSQGLRAENGAEGVGKATMRAVVVSFVFILLFDYIITWMFY